MKCKQALAILPLSLLILPSVHAQNSFPTAEFHGRIQADHTAYDNDKFSYSDGSEVRRMRLRVDGNFSEDWEYRVQYDFAPDDPELRDGYVRYTGIENTRITIGNFKFFSSLEELTSSNNITFTERALPNALVSARRIGIGYQTWSDRYAVQLAGYTNESNNAERGTGITGRFIYRPDLGDGNLLHLGLVLTRQEPDDDTLRLRSRPEAHQDSHRIVDTGTITGVENFNTVGLEAAYVNGRFSAQSEYIRQDISRRTGADPSFDGYYAYVSYFLTDDTRPYSNSNSFFDTVTPSSSSGAWEVAARFSSLDLTDGIFGGGSVDSISLGLNYYMTRDLRFAATYMFTDSDRVAGDDDPNILQLRLRYTF